MPRRRLHGETQKRRKKPQTRLLKRKTSSPPVTATLQPAPFERSTQVERDDLEFLEAMREMQVQRGPWRGESQTRRQAVERVQFLAEDEERAEFLRSMAHLGVRRLPAGDAVEEPPPPPAPAPAKPAASPAATSSPVRRPAGNPPAAAATPGSAGARAAAQPTSASGRAEPIRFEESAQGRALMEELLQEGGFAPELKFAGAAGRPRRAGRTDAPDPHDDREPDSELDLHGKTLEEAIRMVQNFLLVTHRQRLRHVLIITGQGRNSGAGGPVLKDAVYRWLDLNGKLTVRAFARAPARLGGEGAIWVELR